MACPDKGKGMIEDHFGNIGENGQRNYPISRPSVVYDIATRLGH